MASTKPNLSQKYIDKTLGDFDPTSFPAARLFGHILQKGFQAGSVLGVPIAAAFLLYKRKLDLKLITTAMGYSSLAGTGLAGGLGLAKYGQMDQDGLQDRVYRLHYNTGQNRVDAIAGAGAAAGFALAYLVLRSRGLPTRPVNVIGGGSVGSAFGVLAHALTYKQEDQGPNKMLHELKQ